jgi:metal-sulfur cluster biosynthetic enzyme
LGLVYYVAVEDGGTAHVVMATTTRGCSAAAYLNGGARDSALTLRDIVRAEVSLTYDPPWAPGMIAPDARFRLGTAD